MLNIIRVERPTFVTRQDDKSFYMVRQGERFLLTAANSVGGYDFVGKDGRIARIRLEAAYWYSEGTIMASQEELDAELRKFREENMN